MGFYGHFSPFLRTCFAASLNFCTVGNPFLSSMGRSQSRAIVEVVAPVALLPGIALSPWNTARYGRHRQKVVISFRSSLPRTSCDWVHPSLPSLGLRPAARLQPHPLPPARSPARPATIHLASSEDSWTPSA